MNIPCQGQRASTCRRSRVKQSLSSLPGQAAALQHRLMPAPMHAMIPLCTGQIVASEAEARASAVCKADV